MMMTTTLRTINANAGTSRSLLETSFPFPRMFVKKPFTGRVTSGFVLAVPTVVRSRLVRGADRTLLGDQGWKGFSCTLPESGRQTYAPMYTPILCTYIRIYIHTYVHTYVYVYIYRPMYIPMYIHTYVHTYQCTYIPMYIHMYKRTYVHTYVHTYICTYISM